MNVDPAEPYSPVVRRLFNSTAHAGTLHEAICTRVDEQGVRIELFMRVDSQSPERLISALRFKAWGCPHLIAAAEAFCDNFEGRPHADLAEFTGRELMESLDVPVAKAGRILVLADAVRLLGAANS